MCDAVVPRRGRRSALRRGVVETIAERASEPDQVRMPHRIHVRSPFRPEAWYLSTTGWRETSSGSVRQCFALRHRDSRSERDKK